jgi:hypothetical protein
MKMKKKNKLDLMKINSPNLKRRKNKNPIINYIQVKNLNYLNLKAH